jgi:hydroxyacylglutathione hydrolase
MDDEGARPADAEPVTIAPGLRRLTAPNPGPLTFRGTNGYLLGHDAVTVIDPGPDDEAHVANLIKVAGAPIVRIVVTHDHSDHTGAVRRLAELTGAEIVGAPPNPAVKRPYRPDRVLGEGDTVETELGILRTIETPGHTAGHLCLALEGSAHLFSGDHVMGWSTSVVVPPDGSMADYMASLDRLLVEPATIYLPGHGDPVADGPARVEELKQHRHAREAAILRAIKGRQRTVAEIVGAVYVGLDPKLRDAAALSVRAHLDWLAERGLASYDGDVWTA